MRGVALIYHYIHIHNPFLSLMLIALCVNIAVYARNANIAPVKD